MSDKKVILVTGANKGIGLALVRVLLRERADTHLILASRDQGRGEAAVTALVAELGCQDRLELLLLDVTSQQSVQEAAARVADRHGKLYGLVNNAGGTPASHRHTLNLNVTALQNVSEAFLPLMQKGGRIVQMSSGVAPSFVSKCSPGVQQLLVDPAVTMAAVEAKLIAPYLAIVEDTKLSADQVAAAVAELGIPHSATAGSPAYGLSKACVNAYTIELARRAPHVRVNSCTPGFIATDLVGPLLSGSGKTAAELGAETDTERGTVAAVRLLLAPFSGPEETGRYYGSDGLRSPMHKYRSPGDPEYIECTDGTDRVSYWAGRWEAGQTGWHGQQPHKYLLKYLSLLTGGAASCRFLLPLCGKAPDLLHLYKLGHTVTGVEGVATVAEQFFTENNLEYERIALPEVQGSSFQTRDGRLRIITCDFFSVTPGLVGEVDCVYDRGAMEAVVMQDRPAYAKLMQKILTKPGFRYVLNGYEYDESKFPGPPHHLPRAEVTQLFSPFGQVEILEESDREDKTEANRFNLDWMVKVVYLIKSL